MKHCAICDIVYDDLELNFHHLIPKTLHGNKKILKKYTKEFLNKFGIDVCFACHNKIHSCISERELAYEYNSITTLLNHNEIKTWIIWKQKHPDFKNAYNRMTNKRRQR